MAGEVNGLPAAKSTWATAISPQGAEIKMPVFLGLDLTGANAFMLPYGAKVNMRGVNEVVRRSVARRADAGTVKELWTAGDWEITLTGVLMSDDDGKGQTWPENDVRELLKICQERQAVYLNCQKTAAAGIDRWVITSYELPETPGDGNQEFRIVGFSDKLYEPF